MPPRPTSPGLFTNTSAAQPSAPLPGSSETSWLLAHCDGGARGNPGPAGYGAHLQDEHGRTVAELSEFLGNRTNNFAEYSGLLGCLQYALDHHHSRLKVVSDSELMVKQVQGKYQVKSPDLKPLYEEAKRRIARLDGFEITHALRHKNKEADRLANEAMDRGCNDRGSSDRGVKLPGATNSSTPAQSAAPGAIRTATAPAPFPIPIARPDRPAPSGLEHSGPTPVSPVSRADAMLRGFTRDGVVHILGGVALPDGVFVKIIRE